MRIVGGKWRGRRLETPKDRAVRPTRDRVREAMFNILEHRRFADTDESFLLDTRVLDGFAGTGALGLEALSRGARHVTFMDTAPDAVRVIRRNAGKFGAGGVAEILQADCLSPPPTKRSCGLVFLDPPYGDALAEPALSALSRRGWIACGAICCVELDARDSFACPEGFEWIDDRRYGATRMVILRRENSADVQERPQPA
jgi:16S rRNA (guanine966-N2)-methyltransferase